ncbi:mechanosensitive ion channel family protein [Sulfitobacter sp. S190]|uniref:mechanosensitive ion channel family protein n=1 Tax=Sulfitobacter sp. S190 TaxID=2867022 RepID=UPI0021A536D0|nr:mechanosensitive ion channel family protein [Sulfitobacter sp. S190]UWR21263.1 mechanosensitive ion channel family protein [Sulfitobacter sp. S190]
MEDRVERLSNLFNEITAWVIVEIVIAALITWLAIKAVSRVLPVVAEILPTWLRQTTLNTVPIFRLCMLLILVFWVTPLVFNITFQNFIVIGGALSVAIGFAFKDLASSVIAGFIALFEKPYALGDWIRVGDEYGEVVKIGMRSFGIKTPEDSIVTIPHDRIWTENISNANSGTSELMCVASFFLARGQYLGSVSDILRDVAATSVFLNWEKPIIVVCENTSFGVTYVLKAYPYEPRDQFAFVSDLTERGNSELAIAKIKSVSVPDEFGVQQAHE